MNLEELRSKYKPQILAITNKYGAENIRVFGSVARGDAGPDSDVDFLVKFGPRTTFFKSSAMAEELEELLHTKVDLVSERGISKYIENHVLDEATNL